MLAEAMLTAFSDELQRIQGLGDIEKEASALDPITHAIGRGMVRMRETPQRAAAILDFYRKRVGRAMRGGRGHTLFFGEGAPPMSAAQVRPGGKQPKGILAYHQSPRGIEPTTILRPGMKVNPADEIVSAEPFVMPATGLHAYPSKDMPSMAQMLKEPGKHEPIFRRLHEVEAFDEGDMPHWGARPDREGLKEVLQRLRIAPKPSFDAGPASAQAHFATKARP